MLTNYFKIAIRNLLKRRFYSIVNIFGLSIGLTAAALTILYVRHELSYDNFYLWANRTYRISGEKSGTWFAALSAPYSNMLYQRTFPEVEDITRVRRWPPKFIRYSNDKFFEGKVLFTDPALIFLRSSTSRL
jgi:putative ABC transport system permease protein